MSRLAKVQNHLVGYSTEEIIAALIKDYLAIGAAEDERLSKLVEDLKDVYSKHFSTTLDEE